MHKNKTNVMVVGQTPPPVHGQSVMIQALLEGRYEGVVLHHVRLNFSRTTEEVGVFQARKFFMLLKTLMDMLVGRWHSRARILYYPPAGPMLIPVMRDIFLLISTRWLFGYTVFHFHAAGLPEIYPLLPWWLRPLFNLAYRNADLAIFTTEATASQGAALGAKAVTVIPNGIPDNAQGTREDIGDASDYIPQILFMGTLCEGKGLLVLIEACALVQKAGLQFRLTCAGAFRPESFKKEVGELIGIRGLTEVISFPGMLIGDQKVKRFREADVFCYPSHYDCSPIVLIEAMSFGLPIIATRWRGIPDVVGRSGGAFIVEPKRPDLVAERLKVLLRDSELRVAMGRKNRAWFYGHYTLEMFRGRMEKALLDVGCVHNGSG